MDTLKIKFLTRDYLSLQADRFRGNSELASQTRQRFLRTPGIASFEVSPYSGGVFIGFENRLSTSGTDAGEALRLLTEVFPDLLASRHFNQLFRTLH